MKRIVYIIILLTIFQACSSDNKAKKDTYLESVKEVSTATADSISSNILFKERIIEKNDQISYQKIQQIVEISRLLNDEIIPLDVKENSLNLAKSLYKNKDKRLIEKELQSINSQKSDSVRVKNLKIIKTKTLDPFTQQTSYSFDIITYKNSQESILQKNAVIEFKNIQTEIEGKNYYSIKSKIIELY